MQSWETQQKGNADIGLTFFYGGHVSALADRLTDWYLIISTLSVMGSECLTEIIVELFFKMSCVTWPPPVTEGRRVSLLMGFWIMCKRHLINLMFDFHNFNFAWFWCDNIFASNSGKRNCDKLKYSLFLKSLLIIL